MRARRSRFDVRRWLRRVAGVAFRHAQRRTPNGGRLPRSTVASLCFCCLLGAPALHAGNAPEVAIIAAPSADAAAAVAAAALPRQVAELVNAVQPLLTAARISEAQALLAAYGGPDHPWLQRVRGDAAFVAGDFPAAVAAYRAALAAPAAQVPPGTRANLGRALAAAGDRTAAAVELGDALAGGTAPAATANDLAILAACQLEAGAPRRALATASLGRMRYPGDANLVRAELAALQGCAHWDGLAEAAQELLGRTPPPEPADQRLAWQALLAARERGGDADEAAATALAAHRAGAVPAGRVADDLRRAGLFQPALAAYREALASEPATPALLLAAAQDAGDAGTPGEGRAMLARLDPATAATPRARRLGAWLAWLAGDRVAARAALAALLAGGQADSAVTLWAARLAADAGDDLAALDLFARTLGDPAAVREARLAMAIILGKQQRRDEALAQVQAVLELAPGDRHALEVLAWAEALGGR